jgi:hypothetical protein
MHAPDTADTKHIDVTPEMIQAGLTVFYGSGLVDVPSAEDKCIVAEIYQAMVSQARQGDDRA